MLERDFRISPNRWSAWFAERGREDLDLLLFAIWDPIGVSDSAVFAGEYDSYTEGVLAYVQEDDAAGLNDYFRHVATDAMGLSAPEPPKDAARRVLNGAYASAYRWAGRPLPGDPAPQ